METLDPKIEIAKEMQSELVRVRTWMHDCMIHCVQPGLPSRDRYDAVTDLLRRASRVLNVH